jgi:thiamine biosynthesis protein ThiS
MQIIINNQSYAFDENSSLENVVAQLQLEDASGIALALNEEIIPRSKWNETIYITKIKSSSSVL